MSMSERAAYLKGLADGIKLDESKDIEKLLKATIDTINELAMTIDEIDDDLTDVCDQVDAVDEDLADLEDYVYEDLNSDDFKTCEDEEMFYEVECPNCGEVITIDEDILDEGSIECPNCGEELEFEDDFDDAKED